MQYEDTLAEPGFTQRQRVDRAIHTLEGILTGIAIDSIISPGELHELNEWVSDNRKLVGRHPFSELIPRIDAALADGKLDEDEHADILWLCQNLRTDSIFYDEVTSDMQRLQGILHGILADGVITDDEITQLSRWIDDHAHLKGCYPYDEIDSLLTQVLKDSNIDTSEREMLAAFFEDFITYSLARRIERARESAKQGIERPQKLSGLCSVCPELSFEGRCYSFTGASTKATRSRIAELVEKLGGEFSNSVTEKVHFLVVGANGNPAWAFSCYGRKVEQAMKLRSGGHSLLIVHENDFWDATQDYPLARD
jgi:hypothetical protein